MNVPLENVQNKDFGNASETTLASQLKQALETLLGSFHQEKKMIKKKKQKHKTTHLFLQLFLTDIHVFSVLYT